MNALTRRRILSGALACARLRGAHRSRAAPAQADLFGGDVAVLAAILTQSISTRLEPRQPGAPDGQPGPDDDDDARSR